MTINGNPCESRTDMSKTSRLSSLSMYLARVVYPIDRIPFRSMRPTKSTSSPCSPIEATRSTRTRRESVADAEGAASMVAEASARSTRLSSRDWCCFTVAIWSTVKVFCAAVSISASRPSNTAATSPCCQGPVPTSSSWWTE